MFSPLKPIIFKAVELAFLAILAPLVAMGLLVLAGVLIVFLIRFSAWTMRALGLG